MVSKIKNYKKAFIAAIALFLALILILNSVLSLFIQVSFSKKSGDDAQASASNYLANSSSYIDKDNINKKLDVLRLLSPTDWKDYNSAADVYIAREEYDKASKSMSRAIKLAKSASKKDRASLYLKAGCIYTLLEDFEKAIENLESCTKLTDDSLNAYLILAQIYSENKDLDNVIKYMKAYNKKKDDFKSRNLLARAYYSKGDYKNAQVWFDKTNIKSKSKDDVTTTDIENFFYHGLCKLQLKDFIKAQDSLTYVIEYDNEHPEAYYYRAICELENNEYELAYDDLVKAEKFVKDANLEKEIKVLLKSLNTLM